MIKSADLVEVFNKFGVIQEVHIRKGRRLTKNGLPYAFITFETPLGAYKALRQPSSSFVIGDKVLYVGPAKICHQPDVRVKKVGPKYDPVSLIDRTTDLEIYTEDSGYVDGERSCHINDLNDDCLGIIFSYFNVREKLSFEIVCKKWRRVLLDDWARMSRLDLSNETTGCYSLNDRQFKILIRRCGANLVKLELPGSHVMTAEAMYVVGSICTNLIHFKCEAIRFRNASIHLLATNCKKLKSLELVDPISVKDHDLKILFKRLSLESFALTRKGITGTCFPSLPITLKRLQMDTCSELRMPELILGLERVRYLRALRLDNCANLTRTDFGLICSKLPNLVELGLSGYYRNMDDISLYTITKLKNLKILDLSWNGIVGDQVVMIIADGCRLLEQLDVSGCRCTTKIGVTDRALKVVASNTKLTCLKISYLSSVTDDTLDYFAEAGKLKKLYCIGCPAITDEGVSRVLTLCHDLEYLDLSGCSHISNVTMNVAASVVDMGPDDKKLRLFIGGTRVSDMLEPCPYLVIETRSNCVERLRPDFKHDLFLRNEDLSSSDGEEEAGQVSDGDFSGREEDWI